MEKRGSRWFALVGFGIAALGLCSTATAAIPLQLKLAKGKTYYQKSVADQHITQTFMNQQQVIDISFGMGQKLEVLDVDSAGNMRVRHTFTWCMTKQTGPMGTTSYDSAQQASAPAGFEALAALLNQSYIAKLSPKGKVLDIEGVDEMKAAVEKKLPPGAPSGPAGNMIAPFTEKQGVKEVTEGMLAIYPEQAVEPGQSWSDKRTLSRGFSRIEESKWTLQKRENGVATIAGTTTIRTDPEAPPMENQGMKMRFDLSGTQENTIQIAEATGLIQMHQARQQLKGDIKIGDSGQGQPAMAMPMTIESNNKVEMSDKPLEGTTK